MIAKPGSGIQALGPSPCSSPSGYKEARVTLEAPTWRPLETVTPEPPAGLSAHLVTVGPAVMLLPAGQKERAQPRTCRTPRATEGGGGGENLVWPSTPLQIQGWLQS